MQIPATNFGRELPNLVDFMGSNDIVSFMPEVNEPAQKYLSVKVRERDYEAAREVTAKMPIPIIEVFSAWRILWDSATDKERMSAILKVREFQRESELVKS